MSLNLYGQTTSLSISETSSFSEKWTGLEIGLYADNGIYPGLKLGSSYIISEKEKSRKYMFGFRQRKLGAKNKIIQHLADVQTGLYNHPNNHYGIFLGLGYTRMRTNTRNMRTLGLSIEANYLRRTYNIPALELTESGEIEEISGAGSQGLMVALAPSFGKIFGLSDDKREWHLYLKPALQMLQYDFGYFLNASAELGTSVHIFRNKTSKL